MENLKELKKGYSYKNEEEKGILEQVEAELFQFGYIGDGFSEISDSSVDIYYHGLRQWAVENYQYIEEAMEEGLCEGVTDFHELIQRGQYQRFTNLIYENEKELYFNILLELFEEDAEEEILTYFQCEIVEKLETIAEGIDNNDSGDVFQEKIDELLEELSEEYEEYMDETKE